jgi:hypothetical protein
MIQTRLCDEFDQLSLYSPSVDRILSCLGLLFRDHGDLNDDVILVARYQFATKRCLDGHALLHDLERLETLRNSAPGPPRFPLAKWLIDPTQGLGANQTLTRIPISTRVDLFLALRNILVGICCEHPCVLKLHGWNIEYADGMWQVLMVSDRAEPVSLAEFEAWSSRDQSAFLLTVAMGMVEIHSRGVVHNNLANERSIQMRNGRAQICNFCLLDEEASCFGDTVACVELFNRARDETARLQLPPFRGEGSFENSFDGYVLGALGKMPCNGGERCTGLVQVAQEIKNEITGYDFVFDLYFDLVDCEELWTSKDEGLSVADGLAQLTRGLDHDGKDSFKAAVNESISTCGFLRTDFFEAVSA